MRLILWLALTLSVPVQQPAAPAPAQDTNGAKVWIGRYAEFEEFIRSAPIQQLKDIGTGVTRPKRAYFASGGLAGSMVVKNLPPKRTSGYWESYKSEIAAYRIDRMLQMDMVPPTVERRIEGDLMSAQLWVEETRMLKEMKPSEHAPNVLRWNWQVYRQRAFDALIGNIDENATNVLIDSNWNMILIDHSRAFTPTTTLVFEKQMTAIDRPFFDRMKELTEADLKKEVGELMDNSSITAMLKRRDMIVKGYEKLAAEKGEAAVFLK